MVYSETEIVEMNQILQQIFNYSNLNRNLLIILKKQLLVI